MSEKTRKIHDAIVGILIVLGTVLGFKVAVIWFWLPGLVGLLMIQSAFTGFCPVYFILGKCAMSCK